MKLVRRELYRVGGFRLGRWGLDISLGICGVEKRSTEGTELVPVVATREDATEAKYDDQEEGSPEWEAKGRTRCVHVWGCIIRTLHVLY